MSLSAIPKLSSIAQRSGREFGLWDRAAMTSALYGAPPSVLVELDGTESQTSPLIVGSKPLEVLKSNSIGRFLVAAPPGTLERQYVLAHALRGLKVGGELIAVAAKDKGGRRLKNELEGFGCVVEDEGRRHFRLSVTQKPALLAGIDSALMGGAPREAGPGIWTQPGVFSWDRVDPGTERLLEHVDDLSGTGADFGCGLGILSRRALRSPAIKAITLVDIDRRAVDAARRNINDARATIVHDDVRTISLEALNFVIMNPPFHDSGVEDRRLGQTFVRRAAAALRRGGRLIMVANIALPYEALLAELFVRVTVLDKGGGFKVFEAMK